MGMIVPDPLLGCPSAESAAAAVATEAQVRQFSGRQIGDKLATFRSELIACGQELRWTQALLQGGSFVDDTLRMLGRLTCRIGVIGQVKAGKSSLVNALVGKPGLLPTDVNPWTTAVTRLHFGRADAPADVAAEFSFFERNEWEQLANGGGQLRELTQSLVPGFKVELLHKQVDAMRRRSESRLGPALDSLLGNKHVFSTLSPEVLEKYICASLPDTAAEEKGVYSDVIKTADIYFDRSDFGFPTTIIDTPGTNDPYLVRDEIARRALESAHLHIVVLTPQQALSPADVALLRILRGLSKDRIVVFLNRIDQLGDVARDAAAIVQHVREGLRRELPESEFAVVAGSAFWADTALRGSEADVEQAWSARAKAYAQHLAKEAGSSVAIGAGEDDTEQRARSLFLCSGLPALFDVLARLALEGHTGRVLTRVSRAFRELAGVGENAARHALTEVEGGADQEEGDEELRAADAEVKTVLTDAQERGNLLIEGQCTKIAEALQAAMRSFSDAECRKLRHAIAERQAGSGVWSCDLTLLRQQLEETLVAAYRAAEQEMGKLETELRLQLQEVLKRYNPQWASRDGGGGEPGSLELPTLGTPSIVLQLDEPWWKRWWRPGRSSERHAAALDRLIENEFSAIAGTLAQTARTQLVARQSSALEEANVIYVGLLDLLKEQSGLRREQARASTSDEDSQREAAELERIREARIAELKRRASDMNLLADRLEMSLLADRLESIDQDVRREDQQGVVTS
jgi:translation elongation factor EF-Tu-like GTPase